MTTLVRLLLRACKQYLSTFEVGYDPASAIKNAACLKFHLPRNAASFQNLNLQNHSRKKKQPWRRDEYQEGSEQALAIATKAREAKVRTGEKKVEEMEKKIGKT